MLVGGVVVDTWILVQNTRGNYLGPFLFRGVLSLLMIAVLSKPVGEIQPKTALGVVPVNGTATV